ncbi:pilus assembly protein TadG-related protein [Marinitenerispora sediminis]|uniref:pilus assembly protein TadG-related protein n=1 Tax=Marinitenerispora sediminis TaxID=1931232 RepID=UPI001F41A186|nr:pilus assembly protein TadG-related protein [Marinitenerispora sediminis]
MPRPTADERGQASLFLLVGLTLSLFALALLFARLGNANDLRTQAQTAADAAALAAVGSARDAAARQLAEGTIPIASFYDAAVGRTAAERYARANGAILDDIRASDDNLGQVGNIVRVEVRGAYCQQELQEDRSVHWSEIVCSGDEETDSPSRYVGNAAAIAEMVLPDCSYAFGSDFSIGGVECDGQAITSYAQARSLITIRLVAEEGQYLYRPLGSPVDAGDDAEDDEEAEESDETDSDEAGNNG